MATKMLRLWSLKNEVLVVFYRIVFIGLIGFFVVGNWLEWLSDFAVLA